MAAVKWRSLVRARRFKALEIEQSELSELWELLDDGDDAVTIDEFCEGLRKIQSEVKAKEIMECIRKMRQLHNRTRGGHGWLQYYPHR